MTLREKLMNVQQELNAPKDQHNNFGNYSYRSAEGILTALKPLLLKNRLAQTISDEIVCPFGEKYYIKATVTLYDLDSDETISVSAWAREEDSKKGMDSSQITGSCSSYARKYALNGMYAIDDVKDSDATNDGTQNWKKELKTEQAPAQRRARR